MFAKLFEWVAWLHGGGKTVKQVCREWHSFLLGWAEMICLRIPSQYPMTKFCIDEMKNEYHYLQVGRGAGVISWVIILAVLL